MKGGLLMSNLSRFTSITSIDCLPPLIESAGLTRKDLYPWKDVYIDYACSGALEAPMLRVIPIWLCSLCYAETGSSMLTKPFFGNIRPNSI